MAIQLKTLRLINDDISINYSYLLIDDSTNSAVIIDPSWEFEKIIFDLKKNNTHLTAILLTHSHIDHVYSVKPLIDYYNSNVFMSKKEIDFYSYKCPNLQAISDFSNIRIDNFITTPILTPGHTFGSTCYMINNYLFTGDTLFIEGCGLCEDKGASPSKLYFSLNKIKNTCNLETKIYPAHSFGKKSGKTFKYLLKYNIYLQIEDERDFIDFRINMAQKGDFVFK